MKEVTNLSGVHLSQTHTPDVFNDRRPQFTTTDLLVEHHLLNHPLDVQVCGASRQPQTVQQALQAV